jgi:hypothetical protein
VTKSPKKLHRDLVYGHKKSPSFVFRQAPHFLSTIVFVSAALIIIAIALVPIAAALVLVAIALVPIPTALVFVASTVPVSAGPSP